MRLASIAGPQTPESPSSHNQQVPIPYDQLQHTCTPSNCGTPDGCKSLPHRAINPLKSFSVPGPPPQMSAPNTPTPKHIGRLHHSKCPRRSVKLARWKRTNFRGPLLFTSLPALCSFSYTCFSLERWHLLDFLPHAFSVESRAELV